MLYVQDKVVKLGGVYLKGQVTSVEVQEAGSVYVAQDEKGRFKKSQPVLSSTLGAPSLSYIRQIK